ncbi:MAG TPA: metallophosphoesterase [Candidatus Methylomirabilis sp.]|nr:metallophosphoesterase [Candidatus Methylomirabilis sp.]
MRTRRRFRVPAPFALIVLAYAGMQSYAIYKASSGAGLALPVVTGLAGWVVLMTLMPFLLWRLERHGWHLPVVAGAWIGYFWMGLAFLFFWVALGFDLFDGVVSAAGGLLRVDLSEFIPSPWHGFLWSAALTLVLAAYGFVAARRRRVEHVVLSTSKLPAGSDALRIVQISDVHLGAIIGARRLRRILEKVVALAPDVLVSTGDLLDGQADHLDGLARLFDAVQPRLGKFAVTGNHEFYVGHQRALEFTRRCGFTVLSGEAVPLTRSVTLAGVDDPTGRRMGIAAALDEPALLAAQPRERFTILLKHQPVVDSRAAGLFDLQLSGHVHRGQIFPFGLLVRLAYPMRAGLTWLAPQRWLYVSRGTGTWGPPMRVFAPPEITLIEIKPA